MATLSYEEIEKVMARLDSEESKLLSSIRNALMDIAFDVSSEEVDADHETRHRKRHAHAFEILRDQQDTFVRPYARAVLIKSEKKHKELTDREIKDLISAVFDRFAGVRSND